MLKSWKWQSEGSVPRLYLQHSRRPSQ